MMSEDRPINRRNFFRAGLRELLKPLAGAVEQFAEAAKPFTDLEKQSAGYSYPPTPEPDKHWLRPPGSLPEQEFRDTCSRCGECVRACPAQAILLDTYSDQGAGVPYIDPNSMACVACDGLQCMSACPTGALVPTLLADIDMGTAEWDEHSCLRRHGDSCSICVDHCPVGSAALKLNDAGQVEVIEDGCIGCGVCEHDCPTYPKSITVIPKSKRPAPSPD